MARFAHSVLTGVPYDVTRHGNRRAVYSFAIATRAHKRIKPGLSCFDKKIWSNVPDITSDSNGSTLGTYEPDFYGNYRYVTGSRPDTMGIMGNREDNDSRLMYYGRRWLDTDRGKWISEEPYGFDRPGLYSFVMDNPINYFDIAGLKLCPIYLPDSNNYWKLMYLDDEVISALYTYKHTYNNHEFNLRFNSTYRTFARQSELFDNAGKDPNKVAKPGTSKHEAGTAVDINVICLSENQKNDLWDKLHNSGFKRWGRDFSYQEKWHFDMGNVSAERIAATHRRYGNMNVSKIVSPGDPRDRDGCPDPHLFQYDRYFYDGP